MDLVRALGYSGPAPMPHVSLRRPAGGPSDARLRFCLVPGGARGTVWDRKRWPHFGALARALLDRYADAQVCVLGGDEDEWPSAMPEPDGNRVVDLRGRLRLSETAWVLKHSAVAIGNDCGPMHIADAAQTPSVVLFGPTSEVKNGPLARGVTVSTDIACRPCQFTAQWRTCTEPQCMTTLKPEMVVARVYALIDA